MIGSRSVHRLKIAPLRPMTFQVIGKAGRQLGAAETHELRWQPGELITVNHRPWRIVDVILSNFTDGKYDGTLIVEATDETLLTPPPGTPFDQAAQG